MLMRHRLLSNLRFMMQYRLRNFIEENVVLLSLRRCLLQQLDSFYGAHLCATGELFSFGYNVEKAPYCTVTTFDAKGGMMHDVPITLRKPIMMHDCALTEVGHDMLRWRPQLQLLCQRTCGMIDCPPQLVHLAACCVEDESMGRTMIAGVLHCT